MARNVDTSAPSTEVDTVIKKEEVNAQNSIAETPNVKSQSILMIEPLDNVNKELVFKQRMNRPFKVIQNLPISKEHGELPDYSVLKHPLGIKDSAVLYNSLIVSRFNWINHMFKTYWTRREQLLVGASGSNKKDKMVRFCDASMFCGIHTFQVKLFFLKDDEREKAYQEEIERKREERLKRKMEKQEEIQRKKDEKEREEREKEAQRQKIQEEIRLKQEKEAAEKAAAEKIASEKAQNESKSQGETSLLSANVIQPNDSLKATTSNITEVKQNSENSSLQQNESKVTDTSSNQAPKKIEKEPAAINKSSTNLPKSNNNTSEASLLAKKDLQPKVPPTVEQQVKKPTKKVTANDIMSNPDSAKMIRNLNLLAKRDINLSILMKKVANGGASPQEISTFQRYIQKAREMADPVPQPTNNLGKIKLDKTPSDLPTIEKDGKKLSVTAKMKIPVYTPEEAKARQEFLQRRANEIRAQQEKMALEKKKLKEEKERLKKEKAEQKKKDKEEKEEKKRLAREEKEREKELKKQAKLAHKEKVRLEREERARQKQEKIEEKVSLDTVTEDSYSSNSKLGKVNNEEDNDDLWNDKLSPLQERYSTQASLVFEFAENQSARFAIPRDTIYEIIENEQENNEENKSESKITAVKEENDRSIGVKAETDSKAKPKNPYVTLLASFLLVHNQAEIDGWERRKADAQALKDAEEQKKQEALKKEAEENENGNIASRKRRRKKAAWGSNKRATRASKQAKEIEQLRREEENYHEEDDELNQDEKGEGIRPTPVYSCVTITLSMVPFRFADFIKNSGNPPEVCRENMEEIAKTGKRMPLDQLWYQIDGIKDELLGETLRYNLNRLDFQSCGGRAAKNKALLKKIRTNKT